MSFFKDLFGPILTLFVVSEGVQAAASPPPPDNAGASSNDLYGSGGQQWTSRVDNDPPTGLGM